ncbi:hypothetical protein [Campylobacter sp. CS_ED2]|nr:hypothetical protein [Campylobacter sp. CS_ED2]
MNYLNSANLHFCYFNSGDCFEPVGSRNDKSGKFANSKKNLQI